MFEVKHKSVQILLQISLKHRDGNSINASRASIAFNGKKGLVHTGHINPVLSVAERNDRSRNGLWVALRNS
jgi:hypothetical protein